MAILSIHTLKIVCKICANRIIIASLSDFRSKVFANTPIFEILLPQSLHIINAEYNSRFEDIICRAAKSCHPQRIKPSAQTKIGYCNMQRDMIY